MCLLCCKGRSLRYLSGQGNPLSCVVVLYVEEGSKMEQYCLLSSWLAFSHFFHYPQANWALLVLILLQVDLFTFSNLVGLSKDLSWDCLLYTSDAADDWLVV